MLAGQREFRGRLSERRHPARIAREQPGGHVFRPDMFVLDLDGIIARLRPAAVVAALESGARAVTGHRPTVSTVRPVFWKTITLGEEALIAKPVEALDSFA